MDVGLVLVCEQVCLAVQQFEDELLCQWEKINCSLDVLEGYLVDGIFKIDMVNLVIIVIVCVVGYFNFCCVVLGWCVDCLYLVKLVENLFSCESFVCIELLKV